LGTLLDGLAVAAGGQAGYWPGVQKNREWQAKQKRQEAEDAFEREKFAWQKKKDSRPEVRAVGRSIVSLPFEGLPKVVFSAPSDAESYAASLGLKEGDEGYSDAIMDYVLKSSGPTASERHSHLSRPSSASGRTLSRHRLAPATGNRRGGGSDPGEAGAG
jgi:hypothetical protein